METAERLARIEAFIESSGKSLEGIRVNLKDLFELQREIERKNGVQDVNIQKLDGDINAIGNSVRYAKTELEDHQKNHKWWATYILATVAGIVGLLRTIFK